MPIIPYSSIEYYTLDQTAEMLREISDAKWSKHDVSQRAPAMKLERVCNGVFTRASVDRYILARQLTAQARQDGYNARPLLWPDQNGSATWNRKTYK